VPAQDRGDIRHNIILELALARARDGDKPFSKAMMYRVASFFSKLVQKRWEKFYLLIPQLHFSFNFLTKGIKR